MEWKVFATTRGSRSALDIDQIGLNMWMMAVVVIGLSLALRLNKQPAVLSVIAQGTLALLLIGLALITLGVLHVVRMHFRATRMPHRVHLRYARPALLPLWYYRYGVPNPHALPWVRRFASLTLDHGQAWAWGIECVLVVGIIETALMLIAKHPLWHQIGMLIVLAVARTTLQTVREQVIRHGHGSARDDR